MDTTIPQRFRDPDAPEILGIAESQSVLAGHTQFVITLLLLLRLSLLMLLLLLLLLLLFI